MKAKDVVVQEVARQAEFGMEPSWEDFVIAGQEAGIKEVVEWIKPRIAISQGGFLQSDIDWIEWQAKLKEWGIE